jgi:hypothetical protein
MRPFQRKAAELIINDVVNGNPPRSLSDAYARYFERMGAGFHFDTGKSWAGDIRQAAIFTLFENGFRKGKVVKISEDGNLQNWSLDRFALDLAARIEIEWGGNISHFEKTQHLGSMARIFGKGDRAVYIYTDSLLDAHSLPYCKIGRHNKAGLGEVYSRVLQQYGTGNPSVPILRYLLRTNNDVALEKQLHDAFAARRIRNGIGTEWFEVCHEEVKDMALSVIEVAPDT